ncbi:MAG: hypothetical protein H6683_01020 [Deltaproteobacteria bacterium]|nr:hypothetical protein [Deltaproteobacteria bacterium]
MRRVSMGTVGILAVWVLALTGSASAAPPALEYETNLSIPYLDSGRGIAVGSDGSAYVVGNWYEDQNTLDIHVSRISPTGTVLWTVYLPGSGHDYAWDIALDSSDDVYLTGFTDSDDFPAVDALDDTRDKRDAFITKLSALDGSIVFSTFLGGDYADEGRGIAIGDDGAIYVVGQVGSTDFPVTPDAYQDHPSFPQYFYTDAFITKLSADGSEILYSTYFGGEIDDHAERVALDSAGNIIVVGETNADDLPLVDAIDTNPNTIFISKFSPDGTQLLFSTYFGGTNLDGVSDMALDGADKVYLTGSTRSVDFPTTPGAYQEDFVGGIAACEVPFGSRYNCEDVFVSKLDTTGGGLLYSTFLAGTKVEMGSGIAVDAGGRAHVVGYTGSPDFPPDGIEFAADIFVSRFDATGSVLDYSVIVESGSANQGHGIAVDDAGAVYFTGAVNVPSDTYVAKIAAFTPPSCDDGCLIGPTCYDDGTINPSNPCQICVATQADDAWSNNDEASCDDGKYCNGADLCAAGSCSVHEGSPCEFGEICNEYLDSCQGGSGCGE